MSTICIKATVSGKVQGVFFRSSTQKKAQELQLTGWVKNTADGNVELIACGEQVHIMELTEWLWQGPPSAEVSNVLWKENSPESYDGFSVK